jgi:glucose/arabinose dehydrogenase
VRSSHIRTICCCITLVALAAGIQAAELPQGFRLEPVETGLTDPSDVAVAPDGRIFITERTTGDLRQVIKGQLASAPLCHVNVQTAGEAGLLGVAVHPDFGTNGWVYLYYTDQVSGSNKVTRFAVTDYGCGGETPILDLGAGGSYLRNGGGITFGPDGKLYVATGDMGTSGDAQLDVLQGKILRLEDDGSAADGNPTEGSRIYARGVRDGRAVAVADGGQVFSLDAGEVSDLSYDELNAVPFDGNLGWDAHSGGGSGMYDNPLMDWSSSPDNLIGPAGLSVYGAVAFPVYDESDVDRLANAVDDDHDRLGADGMPGVARVDDDGVAYCVGGSNDGLACPGPTAHTFCKARDVGGTADPDEDAFCLPADTSAEYCPGGTAYGDDACGANGTDEPDESFAQNLFFPGYDTNRVMRAVVDPSDPTVLSSSETFLDSSFWPDCPTGWSGVATGNDGWLYLVATNGGGAGAGGLYRVTYDTAPGPREVSPPGSHFPVKMNKGAGDHEVVLFWEDLRTDAMQPRDDGVNPQAPAREYTVWMGTLGSYASHSPLAGYEAIKGVAVNGAMRSVTFTESESVYFIVSGRGDNLEGSLGADTGGAERAGYATTDLCETIGYHVGASPGIVDWLCGQDFTLLDETGTERSLWDYRGRPIVLDFSAVWCSPCNTEANEIEQTLHQTYKDRGVVILTVLTDDLVGGSPYPAGRPAVGDCIDWGDRTGTVNDHTFTCMPDTRQTTNGPQAAWPNYTTGFVPTNVILDTGLRAVYNEAGWAGSGEPSETIPLALDMLLQNSNTCLK